jgi:hypothetical protein
LKGGYLIQYLTVEVAVTVSEQMGNSGNSNRQWEMQAGRQQGQQMQSDAEVEAQLEA